VGRIAKAVSAITIAVPAAVVTLVSANAWAPCDPPVAAGTPAPGTTVTCSGATLNLNPPDNGCGDGSRNGLTINVIAGASVTGDTIGINVNANNVVNNAGTITGSQNHTTRSLANNLAANGTGG
jgi:hypothetical protein